MSKCQCGSGSNFNKCCEPFINGSAFPETAVQLMRSRYVAYVISDIDYIVDTTLPDMKEGVNVEATRSWSEDSSWKGLVINSTEKGLNDDEFGYVDFTATYTHLNEKTDHNEKAFFKKEDGRWYFVPETQKPIRKAEKVGRNELCPCGSGKKFKKCCLNN